MGIGLLVSSLLILAVSTILALLGYGLRSILPWVTPESYATVVFGTGLIGICLLIRAFPVLRITASFEGIIPAETRQRIKAAKEAKDFAEIYVLTEVEEWKVKEVVAPILDPLVVGLAHGRLYLIDRFDTTPLENYIAKEFAVQEP